MSRSEGTRAHDEPSQPLTLESFRNLAARLRQDHIERGVHWALTPQELIRLRRYRVTYQLLMDRLKVCELDRLGSARILFLQWLRYNGRMGGSDDGCE